MNTEVVPRAPTVLVRRSTLNPGAATPWHRDTCRRFTVVIRGEMLAIDYADGERVVVPVHAGQAGWDNPEPRAHRAVNLGASPFEEVVTFYLNQPDEEPQPQEPQPQEPQPATTQMPPSEGLVHTILKFWFGTLTDGFADDGHRSRWFAVDPGFDEDIRQRFGGTLADMRSAAIQGAALPWPDGPRADLALILLTDQFSRNIHRDSPLAFATDPVARATARRLVASGADTTFAFEERAFCYLPFQHSEDLIDQHTSVGLYTQLRDQTPPGYREITGSHLHHAHQHRDTVARFGRFPYRNAALSRTSAPIEAEYLNRNL